MRRMRNWAAAGGLALSVVPACGSGGGGGGGAPDGGGGSGGSSQALALCKSICESVPPVCPDVHPDVVPDCLRNCDETFAHPRAPGCPSQLLAHYQCLSKPNNVECFDLTFHFVDECMATRLPLDQCMQGEVICGVASPPPSGGACYEGRGECNLMLDDCPSGKVCGTEFGGATKCFEIGPTTVSEPCAACDAISVNCVGGSSCYYNSAHGHQCARYCCTDADCDGTPGSCWEYDTKDHIKFCYR